MKFLKTAQKALSLKLRAIAEKHKIEQSSLKVYSTRFKVWGSTDHPLLCNHDHCEYWKRKISLYTETGKITSLYTKTGEVKKRWAKTFKGELERGEEEEEDD